jgi:hypothetical protein
MAALYDIKALQRTLLELQQELPDSSLQTELQRLQNQLNDLAKQPPAFQPRAVIVQPTPRVVTLTGHELAVYHTFTRFLSAVSPLVPVQNLPDVAASLTLAAYSGEHGAHHQHERS